MELTSVAPLSITPLYIALLGLLWIIFTLRVGLYRNKNKINLGDGGDPELQRRIRGQGNFIESVPLAVVLLVVMELVGAPFTLLHILAAMLVAGRLLHYIGVTDLGPFVCRPIGMFATLSVYLVGGLWIIYSQLA